MHHVKPHRKSVALMTQLLWIAAFCHGMAGELAGQVTINNTGTSGSSGIQMNNGGAISASSTQVSIFADTSSTRGKINNGGFNGGGALLIATWPCSAPGCIPYAAATTFAETGLGLGSSGTILTSNGSIPVWSSAPTLGNSTVTGTLTFAASSSNTITLTPVNPSMSRTYTIPDFGGNENLTAVSGTPTSNDMAKWGTSGLLVDDATLTDNATTLTYSGTGGLSLAGGLVFSGTQGAPTTISTTTSNATLFLAPNGTGAVQLGGANSSSPQSRTLAAQGSRGGTDTNVAGADVTIESGDGTGNSVPSHVVISAPAQGTASGSTAQSYVQRMILNGTKTGLSTGTAQSLFTVNLSALTMAGGLITYVLEATDGTDVCALFGQMAWVLLDKAGTYSSNVLAPVLQAHQESGSNCNTFSATGAFSSNIFQLTPTLSTMSPTTFRITYSLQNYGQSTITLN
jgi:hypothetical protein